MSWLHCLKSLPKWRFAVCKNLAFIAADLFERKARGPGKRSLGAFGAALLCLSFLGGTASAWGPQGHVVIAMVAEDRLTPNARKAVRKMLLGAPLATTAIFADEYRVTHPETFRWHFVDIPFEESDYLEQRDCQVLTTGDCVIHAIERAKATIKDTSAKPFDRADALKYLVHFVGDLHQPFHAIERKQANGKGDEGGNLVDVKFFGEPTNLHTLWDSGLIFHAE
jgi:hypothetical protein